MEERDEVDMKIKNVPDELRQLFKIYCIRRKKTMSQVLIEFMQQVTKDEK